MSLQVFAFDPFANPAIAPCRLAGALAGKVAGTEDVVEKVDAPAIKASGVTGSANTNARRRKGR
jgi:hypothetical protein